MDIATWVDDETDGAGTDVLSQGEVNALALALFLPRVDLVASPSGFVLIDDPVQATDPAKVDGLARVLSQLSETRQVVVFTHDVRRRVVPRLCRDALERRCKEIFYRRELRSGAARNDIEQQWQQARQTKNRLMLVVNRSGDRDLNRWLGSQSHRHEALGASSSAVHNGWNGDPKDAVDSTERIVADLARDHG